MSIKAMKQALEALQNIHPGNMTPMAEEAWDKAIASLRKAIEQAEQAQPVAWIWMQDGIPFGPPCYGKPPDVDIAQVAAAHGKTVQLLYTSPPPRQPLTDEEIEQCMKQAYATVQGRNLEHAFARAIEAAHNIKE